MDNTTNNYDYAAMETPALLDLLIKEEDRVTEAHVRELAQRTDAHSKLSDWL